MKFAFDELILGPTVEFSFFIRNNMDGTRSIFRWSEPETELGRLIDQENGQVVVVSNANNGSYVLCPPWTELLSTPHGIFAALDRADLNSPYYL